MRDLDHIATTLRAIVPGGHRITGISPLTTGFSNETYRIDGPELILRLPSAAGEMLDGHDVLGQARIYAALGEQPGAPPVPRIVAIGGDESVLGAPWFVMERVAGESIDDLNVQPWLAEGAPSVREQVCRDWISTFSSLALLPTLDILGPAVSPEDDARMWQSFALAANSASLAALFDRLLAHPAPRSGSPAIIHGDPKLSNLMWHEGKVSAVLDWEMSLNGEPLADLGYMLYAFKSDYKDAARAQTLPGMLTRDQVIALWVQITGRSAEGLFWHEIAQMGKIAAIVAEGTNMHVTGRSDDPKLAHFAAVRDHYIAIMCAMLDDGGY